MEYFVGISMSSTSTVETGVVVLDNQGKIILVDKLYKMKDIQFFLDNFSSLRQSHIAISLPWDNSMLTQMKMCQIVIIGLKDMQLVVVNIIVPLLMKV